MFVLYFCIFVHVCIFLNTRIALQCFSLHFYWGIAFLHSPWISATPIGAAAVFASLLPHIAVGCLPTLACLEGLAPPWPCPTPPPATATPHGSGPLRCRPIAAVLPRPLYSALPLPLPSPPLSPEKNSDGPQQPNWENSARKPHKGASSVEKAMSPASSMAQSFWLFESERLRDPIWKRLFSNKGLGVCPGILPMASFLSLARPTHPTQLLLRCWGVVAQWVPRNACVTNCFRETFHHPMECKAFVTFVGSYHIRRNGEGTQTFFAISFFKLFSCCFFSAAAGQHLWWSKIWWNAQILFFET